MEALSLRRLLLLSLRAGNLTFGGGDPTMAVLQRELVNRRGWMTAEQYGLSFGLARITPGTNVLAFCAAAGWLLLRWRGAAVMVLSASLPSGILVVALTHAFDTWRSTPAVAGLLAGIAAAAVGMMAAAVWLLVRPGLTRRDWLRTLILSAGAAVLLLKFSLSPLSVLLLAAAAGFFWREREP